MGCCSGWSFDGSGALVKHGWLMCVVGLLDCVLKLVSWAISVFSRVQGDC